MSRVEPSKYWTLVESTDWTCNLVDPEGHYGAYIKGDGCVNLWGYDNPKVDRSVSGPTYRGEDDFYEHICDIDERITRLIALREMAIRYFEEHGASSTRDDWYYGKPFAEQIETLPPRAPEEVFAQIVADREEQYAKQVKHYTAYGIEEKDIDNLLSISKLDDQFYTIRLRDGRTWQKSIEEVEQVQE